MRLATLVGVAIGALALAAIPAAASHRHTPHASVLTLKFKTLQPAQFDSSDGRYVLLVPPFSPAEPPGTLIDETTGATRSVTVYPECTGVGTFGGPWLFGAGCVSASGKFTVPLYSLSTGHISDVTINDFRCNAGGAEQCRAVLAGRNWLGIELTGYHEPAVEEFQNLQTGAIKPFPMLSPTTQLDLGASTLTSKICSPLRSPDGSSLSFYGRFAVYQVERHHAFADYLERCSSRLRLRLPSLVAYFGNSSAIMWPRGARQIDGIALPSLHRFKIRTPAAFDDQSTGFVLASRTLYARDAHLHLWGARWSPPR
jgi:hypothetical protein